MQYYSRFRMVFVFDVRFFSYYLVRLGQQLKQYYSSFCGSSVFDETMFFYTSLDQQLLSQAWIEPGNKPLTASIGKVFFAIIMQFFHRQNDKKKTKYDYRLPNW